MHPIWSNLRHHAKRYHDQFPRPFLHYDCARQTDRQTDTSTIYIIRNNRPLSLVKPACGTIIIPVSVFMVLKFT